METRERKVGDTVLVRRCGDMSGVCFRRIITSITPSGRIVLSTGSVFNADGSQRGGNRLFSRLEIVEPAPAILESIRIAELRQLIAREIRGWEQWPVARLELFAKFVEDCEKES
jgi:hypothetical protein